MSTPMALVAVGACLFASFDLALLVGAVLHRSGGCEAAEQEAMASWQQRAGDAQKRTERRGRPRYLMAEVCLPSRRYSPRRKS